MTLWEVCLDHLLKLRFLTHISLSLTNSEHSRKLKQTPGSRAWESLLLPCLPTFETCYAIIFALIKTLDEHVLWNTESPVIYLILWNCCINIKWNTYNLSDIYWVLTNGYSCVTQTPVMIQNIIIYPGMFPHALTQSVPSPPTGIPVVLFAFSHYRLDLPVAKLHLYGTIQHVLLCLPSLLSIINWVNIPLY